MKKFTIEVVFSTSITVDVLANNKQDAMDKAEYKASEDFGEWLDKGLFGTSDFDCEAQMP